MNIYKCDFGHEGALVCVADSRDQAWDIFYEKVIKYWHQANPGYKEYYLKQIEEYSIHQVVETVGSGY